MPDAIETAITSAMADSTATAEIANDIAPVDTPVETPAAATETPAAEPGVIVAETTPDGVIPPVAEPTADELFAKEHGYELKDKTGTRENRLPHSRVVKITEKAVNTLAEAVLGRPIVAGENVAEVVKAHVARLPELESEVTHYKSELASVAGVEKIMTDDPAKFLQMLPFINPEYAKLIGQVASAATAAPVTAPVGGPMPEPDYDLGEGKGKTYSQAGLVKLLDWQASQTQAKVLADVDKRFKPITDEREAKARYDAQIPRITAAVEHGRQNWKGFKDHEPAILAEINAANARRAPIDLHEGYIRVMNRVNDEALTKATADRGKMRAEILAEMNKQPTSTAVAPKVALGRTAEKEPTDIESIIKKAAGLK